MNWRRGYSGSPPRLPPLYSDSRGGYADLPAVGFAPGASTAATRITQALQTPAFANRLHFDKRELEPLLDAAETDPRTWADLLHASDMEAIPPSHGRRLVTTCETLREDLAPHRDQDKIHALRRDLEHLRDQLRILNEQNP